MNTATELYDHLMRLMLDAGWKQNNPGSRWPLFVPGDRMDGPGRAWEMGNNFYVQLRGDAVSVVMHKRWLSTLQLNLSDEIAIDPGPREGDSVSIEIDFSKIRRSE